MKKSKLLTILLMLVFVATGISAVSADTWTSWNHNTDGIENKNMQDVEVDGSGNVWIATNGGGVSKYDGSTWTNYKTSQGLVNNTTKDICIDGTNIWVATSGGVSKFDGTNFTNYTTSNSDIATNNTRDIYVDGSIVWIGTYGSGLDKFDGANWTNWQTGNSDIPNNRIWDIEEDSSGNLWLCTEGGISKFDKNSTFTNYNRSNSDLLANTVKDCEIDSAGNIWIANYSGMNKFDGTNWDSWQTGDGMGNNNSNDLEIDSAGIIWIGHNANGVSKYDGTSFTLYNTGNSDLIGNTVYAVHVEADDEIWFGTGEGLSRLEISGAAAPVADFSGSPTSGDEPLTVNFTDASTGSITSHSWNFISRIPE
jgi:ligand-binding sensor domain-containing protein